MKARNPHRKAGFTLAELLVATTLLTILMTAVYTTFGSAMRGWKHGETNMDTFQDARIATSMMARELGCMLGGAEYLFQGKDDEFEFFAVAPSMDVEEGEGARVLWIRYRFNRAGHTLIREEAVVKDPLPLASKPDEEPASGRVKKGRTHKYEIASNVNKFEVSYQWIDPPKDRKADEPPEWLEPIVMDEIEEGWGLPQGITFKLTVQERDEKGEKTAEPVTFTYAMAFRGPTSQYDEKKMGEEGEDRLQ